MSELITGTENTIKAIVTDDRLAVNIGSGGLEVLATPALAALLEKAAFEMLETHLAEGITTVGTKLVIEHTRATAAGAEITAGAKLVDISDRKYTFELSACDSIGEIAHGTHERFAVKTARFMEKVRASEQ